MTAVFLLLPVLIIAQDTGTISGKVTTVETGEALPGANVVLKGTPTGAATGLDGTYTISNIPAGTYTLVASYVGYKTKPAPVTVVAGGTATVDFVLKEDIFLSEETVVTGIASRTSKEVAEVAVARVNAASFTESNRYQSVSQLVNGKVPGVTMTPTSGNAGGGFRFNVRSGGGLNGDEQPVVYIDGVRVDNAQFTGFGVGGQGIDLLSSLNPEDIEKMEILKGPAGAASYGTNGSNGVILITTKRGGLKAGQSSGIAIDYKVTAGSNRQSYEYDAADFVTAARANNIFRNGNILQQTVNASGGNPRLKYYASYDRRDEEGITRNNSLNRTSLRANLDIFPNDKLTLRVNSGYTFNKLLRPNNDNNIFGYLANVLLRATPYLFTDSTSIEGIKDETIGNRFTGSASAEYTPYKNLTGRFTIGVDDDNIRQDQNFPLNLTYGVAQQNSGERRIFNRRSSHFTYTLDGRYEYDIAANLRATSIVGAQLLNRRLRESFIDKFQFSTELISNVGAGAQLANTDENFTHRREAGIFTEHSFAYKDQYYMTLGLRRDYASVVGKEAPSINYPKASLAVRMDKYDFFPNLFSLMKLRAGYGETGILPDLLDGVDLLYEAEPSGFGPGATIQTVGNPEIRPERVKEFEVGFEAEFLDNYSAEFTYYIQRIEDSIIDFRNSPSTGIIATALPFNVGSAKGSGVEVLLQASLLRSSNWGLDLSLIGSYQQNEVTDLGGAQPIFDGFDNNVITKGMPKHEFYVRQVTAASYTTSGPNIGYYSGGTLTADRVRLGNPIPDYTGSFTVNFRFLKNFNLYALSDWATGLKLLNFTEVFSRRFGNDPEFNRLATELGVAAGSGRAGGVGNFSTPVPGVTPLTPGTPEYQAAAERFARLDWRYNANFIEDADFLKLREVSLTYSLKELLPKIGLNQYFKDLVVGFSARNIWTTTKYSAADVEVNHNGARSLTRGNDFLTLQSPRTFNFTLKASL
jgi:TonB-dependent SusC/RagA subfamily outer membrane receptor